MEHNFLFELTPRDSGAMSYVVPLLEALVWSVAFVECAALLLTRPSVGVLFGTLAYGLLITGRRTFGQCYVRTDWGLSQAAFMRTFEDAAACRLMRT